MQIDGGCHCGNITYEAIIGPDHVFLCHCTDCQVISGAPYRSIVRTSEKDFTLKIGDISTKGRIDRIDKLDDGYEIVDYKTGKPKDKLSWPERKQLVLYALACERCFDPPLKITKATYHYLEDNSSVSFEPTDKEKQKLIDEVIKAVEKMQASDFSPTPGFHCQYCDFKDICEDSSF